MKKPAVALRDPHKSALINQHHILVGSGEVIKNGEHEKPWGSSYAAIADNVPLL